MILALVISAVAFGGLIGSGIQYYYTEHARKRAGRLFVSADGDGMYLTAAIENASVIKPGNIVEFEIVEGVQNDAD